jgi:hypothetical protein
MPLSTGGYLQGVLTFSSPLMTTSLYHHPYLTAVGVLLQSYLAKITYTSLPKDTALVSGAAALSSVEQMAMQSLVTTSPTNRRTRLLLGLVHLIAGTSLAWRSQHDLDKNKQPWSWSSLAWQSCSMGGIVVLFSVAATWLSSSYYGQWGRGAHPKRPSWNPDGLGWRLMPEALRKPFLIQGSQTTKTAFRYAIVTSLIVRIVAFLYYRYVQRKKQTGLKMQ